MAEQSERPEARSNVLGCRQGATWVGMTYTVDGENESDGHWLCELHTPRHD
jgi:hypothetical protein